MNFKVHHFELCYRHWQCPQTLSERTLIRMWVEELTKQNREHRKAVSTRQTKSYSNPKYNSFQHILLPVPTSLLKVGWQKKNIFRARGGRITFYCLRLHRENKTSVTYIDQKCAALMYAYIRQYEHHCNKATQCADRKVVIRILKIYAILSRVPAQCTHTHTHTPATLHFF
jgi:hypothetical protein